jgi:transcriptional regulator with XRE-family HTH domain
MSHASGTGWTGAGSTRHSGPVDESRQWAEFGKWLVEQREERGLRRRDAARKAKISEVAWRDLETGRKEAIGGIRLLPNPSQDVLKRVAEALDVPVEDVLARIGRPNAQRAQGPRALSVADVATESDGSLLALKLKRLSERDRVVVERIVDAMLETQEG